MGIDIDKGKVVLLPDEFGVEHFGDFYTNLAELANESHIENVQLHFIRAVLKRLRTLDRNDLPQDHTTSLSFDFKLDVDGISYTRPLEIVKKLGKSVVYELRIDIDEFNWYFRATFFPKYHDSQLYHCVVYPFVKIPGESDPTDQFRDLTHDVYKDTQINPEKYFN
ncbi:hypothetical protein JNUCC23_23245 (plasmid) [Peribacillus sp. JNUCC 23]